MSTTADLESAPKIPVRIIMALGIVATTGLIVGGAQLLPPLTAPDPTEYRHVSDRALIHQVDELAFCQDTLQGVDCGCFSYRASAVLRADQPRVRGMMYADKWQLAVAQASTSCRR